MLYGRLVHVGGTFNRVAYFWLYIAQKRVWQLGFIRTRWGSYRAPPDPSRYKEEGREGSGKKDWEYGVEGREGQVLS